MNASKTTDQGAEVTTSDGRALPLRGVNLKIEARGGIARALLEQRYENPYEEALHVTYRMPLPADGAVSGYAFEIGERRIVGVVDKKAAAREKFERAIAQGKTAALLEQERDDIFTQQIGNIPPRETIVARIAVDMRLVWLAEGEWELRFPTVIGPRYVSDLETPRGQRDASAVAVTTKPEGVSARMFFEVSIADDFVDGRKPSSPTHKIATTNKIVSLTEGAKLDRDLVIRWPVASAKLGASLAIARPPSTAEISKHAYGLVTIVPPTPASKPRAVARDLLILLDTSGSMGGAPLDKAQQVLPLMIETLGEGDRLEMIEFSNSPRRYKEGPREATAKEKSEAIKWIKSRRADGGTEMRTAVIEALSTLRLGAQRQVVLVTDGYVGGEQQILEVLHAKLPKSCRLHVLGVGSAVNRSLATALARAGRGAEVLVGPDEDAERGAKRLLDRTKSPVFTNVEIVGTALVNHVPEHVPDVFAGAPLVAAVALKPEGGELVVRGDIAGGDTWEHRVKVPATTCGDGEQAIVSLYGREHVADLESRAAMEYGMHDRAIEETGVAFQISTRLTSWVAVDESRVVKAPVRSEEIPQELPYGTHAASFGLRQGMPVAGKAGAPMMKTMMIATADEQDFGEEEVTGGYAESKSVAIDDVLAGSAPMQEPAKPAAPMAPSRPRISAGFAQKKEAAPMQEQGRAGGAPFLAQSSQARTGVAAPAPMKQRSRMPLFLLVMLLIALIALLFRWLA